MHRKPTCRGCQQTQAHLAVPWRQKGIVAMDCCGRAHGDSVCRPRRKGVLQGGGCSPRRHCSAAGIDLRLRSGLAASAGTSHPMTLCTARRAIDMKNTFATVQ